MAAKVKLLSINDCAFFRKSSYLCDFTFCFVLFRNFSLSGNFFFSTKHRTENNKNEQNGRDGGELYYQHDFEWKWKPNRTAFRLSRFINLRYGTIINVLNLIFVQAKCSSILSIVLDSYQCVLCLRDRPHAVRSVPIKCPWICELLKLSSWVSPSLRKLAILITEQWTFFLQKWRYAWSNS